MDTQGIISLLSAIVPFVVGVVALITAISARGKNKADAANLITNSNIALLQEIEKKRAEDKCTMTNQSKEILALKKEVTELKNFIRESVRGEFILIAQLKELNIVPKWTPREFEERETVV
jgi:hypothetical protein